MSDQLVLSGNPDLSYCSVCKVEHVHGTGHFWKLTPEQQAAHIQLTKDEVDRFIANMADPDFRADFFAKWNSGIVLPDTPENRPKRG